MKPTDRTNLAIGVSNLALRIQERLVDDPRVILKELDAIRQKVSGFLVLDKNGHLTDSWERWFE